MNELFMENFTNRMPNSFQLLMTIDGTTLATSMLVVLNQLLLFNIELLQSAMKFSSFLNGPLCRKMVHIIRISVIELVYIRSMDHAAWLARAHRNQIGYTLEHLEIVINMKSMIFCFDQ